MPTIINPLREQWSTVQVAAEAWLQQGKTDKARDELQLFHHHLCEIRILDPACGSGNFLYVALEHLKRLEGEVLNTIADLSKGQMGFETQGLTVDPHQFLGLELNPRAAAIAELVLWIGYLQWHYRIHGKLDLPDPILRDFHNIENRDALIDYTSRELLLDDQNKPVTIWDGLSYKTSPVTGELVPDDQQRSAVYQYENPTAPPGRRRTISSATRRLLAPQPCAVPWAMAMLMRCARSIKAKCRNPPILSCTGGTERQMPWARARPSNLALSPPTACARPLTAGYLNRI